MNFSDLVSATSMSRGCAELFVDILCFISDLHWVSFTAKGGILYAISGGSDERNPKNMVHKSVAKLQKIVRTMNCFSIFFHFHAKFSR